MPSQIALETLADDVGSLWVPNPEDWKIPVLEEPPSALHFLRDFVSISRPCIIRNATKDHGINTVVDLLSLVNEKSSRECDDDRRPSFESEIDEEESKEQAQPKKSPVMMKVAVTPDGHGDCIRDVEAVGPTFVEPLEVELSLENLLQKLIYEDEEALKSNDSSKEYMSRVFPQYQAEKSIQGKHSTDDVYYYSRQNDCLRQELPHVWEALNVPDSFPWAEEAFGTGSPDAVNLWLGNHRVISSMHKDHYENLFLVISGEKVFTLCPPSDVPFLYNRQFPHGQFRKNNLSEWCVETKNSHGTTGATWIAADVTRSEHLKSFPLLRHAHPVTVHVRSNELLYLPSLWFHRVTQTQTTLAVNYWYDMRFDSPHWCYFHYLQVQSSIEAEHDDKG